MATRYEANEEYYGKPVYPADILEGKIPPAARCAEIAGCTGEILIQLLIDSQH